MADSKERIAVALNKLRDTPHELVAYTPPSTGDQKGHVAIIRALADSPAQTILDNLALESDYTVILEGVEVEYWLPHLEDDLYLIEAAQAEAALVRQGFWPTSLTELLRQCLETTRVNFKTEHTAAEFWLTLRVRAGYLLASREADFACRAVDPRRPPSLAILVVPQRPTAPDLWITEATAIATQFHATLAQS